MGHLVMGSREACQKHRSHRSAHTQFPNASEFRERAKREERPAFPFGETWQSEGRRALPFSQPTGGGGGGGGERAVRCRAEGGSRIPPHRSPFGEKAPRAKRRRKSAPLHQRRAQRGWSAAARSRTYMAAGPRRSSVPSHSRRRSTASLPVDPSRPPRRAGVGRGGASVGRSAGWSVSRRERPGAGGENSPLRFAPSPAVMLSGDFLLPPAFPFSALSSTIPTTPGLEGGTVQT